MNSVTGEMMDDMLRKEKDALVIEVQAPADYDAAHIPESLNIPFTDQESFVTAINAQQVAPDQKIIVFCADTSCDHASQAQQALLDAGYTNVWEYEPRVQPS